METTATNNHVQTALLQVADDVLAHAPKQSKLDELRMRKEQLEARIRDLQNRDAQRKRKEDTVRLILIGRATEEWARSDMEFRAELKNQLDRFATRPRDRELLGLPINEA